MFSQTSGPVIIKRACIDKFSIYFIFEQNIVFEKLLQVRMKHH